MTLTYKLDQNDYLQHQLFVASKKVSIKKKRTRSWLIVSACMFLLSFLFNQSDNSFLGYYFLAFGFVTLMFYPLYQRNQHKDHYAKFIADTYKNRFRETSNILFTEHAIEISDITGETKINLSQLEKMTETAAYFYIGLKSGGHLIIPKSKISEVVQLRNLLKQLCEEQKISFIEDLNWKWK